MADLEALRLQCRFDLLEERAERDLGLFIPLRTPKYSTPDALRPIMDLFDRIRAGEQVFATIEAPPRHGKSEVLFHGSSRELRYAPHKRVCYATYSADFAEDQSRLARECAVRSGVSFGASRASAGGRRWDPSASVRHWQTSGGGGFLAIGRGGAIVGKGVDLMIIDDPTKNREEAESPVISDEQWDWYRGTMFTRCEPECSILVCHQRWNESDLISRIKRQQQEDPENTPNWVHVTLPAMNDNGVPLWPERYDERALRIIRASVGEYNWWSQYMQRPRPKGDRLFGEPTRFEPPTQLAGKRIAIAVDPASTTKTRADNTAICLGAYWRDEDSLTRLDVLRMWAVQREVPETVDFLWQLQQEWPGAPIVVETQGGEGRAVAQTLRRMNQHLNIVDVTCGSDKFTRAQPASAAWNGGRIRVPQREYDPKSKLAPEGSHPAWIAQMLDELQRFTGVGDRSDDQVDALVHLYNFADSQADVRSVRLGAKRQYQRAGY